MSSLIKKVPSSNGYDLFNGDFEEGIKHYRTYKDSQVASPEDGIGGTPQYVSITASNINPLLGNNSGIISKSLGNGQGEGVSIDFELSDGVLNNNALLSFIYTTSSNYVTGDIKLFLYDITNSLVYNISDTDLSSSVNVSKHEANIWFNATSKKYRLIFHIASTNTNAYTIKLDDIKINNEVKVIGSVISGWNSYTPTFQGMTSPTNIDIRYARLGSMIHINGTFTTGGVNSDPVGVSLPPGLTCNFQGNNLNVPVGEAFTTYTSTGVFGLCSIIQQGTSFIRFGRRTSAGAENVPEPGTSTSFSNGTSVRFNATIPITQWGSNTNLITDFQEFASNSSSTDADDFTSFVYGPEGSAGIFNINNLGATPRTKRVRFKNAIKPNDDFSIEIHVINSNRWIPIEYTIHSFHKYSTYYSGIRYNSTIVNSTDLDIIFYQYASPDAIGWVSMSANYGIDKWRVRKISNGNSAESIPSGIYESGSNANGSWIKYIDGTMECWHRVSTNISTDYLFFNWTYPVPFTSEPIVSTKLSAGGSAVWALHSSSIGTASSVTNITYYKTQQGTYANPNYLDVRAIGKWNNALQVYAPGALVGITIEESGSNSNGSYIKYSDGTMVCYHNNISSGATITFPFAFIEIPSIVHELIDTTSTSTLQYTFRSTKNRTTTSFSFGVGGAGSASYMAIGRWK